MTSLPRAAALVSLVTGATPACSARAMLARRPRDPLQAVRRRSQELKLQVRQAAQRGPGQEPGTCALGGRDLAILRATLAGA
jgi:hypothetical protein